MVFEGALKVFLIGCGGGFLNELLHWWNLRDKSELPEYARSLKYWIITVLMIPVGGAMAWFYFGQKANAILALHVGLSTPLILQKLIVSIPEPGAVRGRCHYPSVRSFFKW